MKSTVALIYISYTTGNSDALIYHSQVAVTDYAKSLTNYSSRQDILPTGSGNAKPCYSYC